MFCWRGVLKRPGMRVEEGLAADEGLARDHRQAQDPAEQRRMAALRALWYRGRMPKEVFGSLGARPRPGTGTGHGPSESPQITVCTGRL